MDIKIALKKIEPFIAIGIFIFLIIISTLLYQEHKITSKISEDCGWGEEDYYCVCEKSSAQQLRNVMENKEVNLSDVKLVR